MFENVRIKERLTKAFVMVAAITAIGAVVGLAAMLVMSNRELRFFTGRYRQGDDHICQHEISDQRNHRI